MAKKIAITGGIGSGKSTVLSILRDWGYPVFSCDEIYAEIIKDPNYVERIKKAFPMAAEGEAINRKVLSEIVFSDDTKRKLLEEISHPMIMDRLQAYMRTVGGELLFAEVPLLFENGFEKQFDGIIVVDRELDSRISSVRTRSGISEAEILKRIAAQFNYEKLISDRVYEKYEVHFISNNQSVEILKEKLKQTLCLLEKNV